jgi:hypothetical protein
MTEPSLNRLSQQQTITISPMSSAHNLPITHSQMSSVKMVDMHPIKGGGGATPLIPLIFVTSFTSEEKGKKSTIRYLLPCQIHEDIV